MKRRDMLIGGFAVAAVVIVEVYVAGTGAILAIWLRQRQVDIEQGLPQMTTVLELRVQPGDGVVTGPLAIGVALTIDGQEIHVDSARGSGRAAAVVILPAEPGQSRYGVRLPKELTAGDRVQVHLYELSFDKPRSCTVEWSLRGPNRDMTMNQPLVISEAQPALQLELSGFSTEGNWEPKWERAP